MDQDAAPPDTGVERREASPQHQAISHSRSSGVRGTAPGRAGCLAPSPTCLRASARRSAQLVRFPMYIGIRRFSLNTNDMN